METGLLVLSCSAVRWEVGAGGVCLVCRVSLNERTGVEHL